MSRPLALFAFALAACPSLPAHAHTSERAFVLTLPTGLYVAGGTLVVVLSFLLVALTPMARTRSLAGLGRPLGRVPRAVGDGAGVVSLALTVALVAAGVVGTQDPLANPLPLTVWTLWWIGFTAAHAVFGDLWSAANPWRGAHALLRLVPGLRAIVERPPLRYPPWLGAWPAVAGFAGFAWFELVSVAPQAPEILARAVALYFSVNLAGTLAFGLSPWLREAEAFSMFFRMVAWLSPLNGRPDATGADRVVVATLPGLGLLRVAPPRTSGAIFVLLALGTVSFDGLAQTFWWLDLIGVNPLEFPGRSAVTVPNTLGLLAMVAVLAAAFGAAVRLGQRMSRDTAPYVARLGATVVSIVPIALGYHMAHYLTSFLVDAQYAAIAANDPLNLGWDLVGLGDAHVTTSFLNELASVRLIWHAQVGIVVIAHVVAVGVGHLLAVRHAANRGDAMLGQAPLTTLMIAYTLFGLWLLATPVAG